MLLVPRQLMRSGMTGDVPYYGGRFTPAQAYAASHPQRAPPPRPATSRAPVGPVRPHRARLHVTDPRRRRPFGSCATPAFSPPRSTTT